MSVIILATNNVCRQVGATADIGNKWTVQRMFVTASCASDYMIMKQYSWLVGL